MLPFVRKVFYSIPANRKLYAANHKVTKFIEIFINPALEFRNQLVEYATFALSIALDNFPFFFINYCDTIVIKIRDDPE